MTAAVETPATAPVGTDSGDETVSRATAEPVAAQATHSERAVSAVQIATPAILQAVRAVAQAHAKATAAAVVASELTVRTRTIDKMAVAHMATKHSFL